MGELWRSIWGICWLLLNKYSRLSVPLEWPISPKMERLYFWCTKVTTSEMSWRSSYHQNWNLTWKEAYLKDALSAWRKGKSKRTLMKGRFSANARMKKASLCANSPWQSRTKWVGFSAWCGTWKTPVISWPYLLKNENFSLWWDMAKFKKQPSDRLALIGLLIPKTILMH